MVKPAPFSRLQLAAALIEYDNDPLNPSVLQHFAQESAIFSHFRRNDGISRRRRSKDYLGVAVPSEAESEQGQRRSRGSLGTLRNPFGSADDDDEPLENPGMEVDLASWGLDAFVEKDKNKGKGKAKAGGLPNPHPQLSPSSQEALSVAGETARAMGVGTLSDFGVGGAFLDVDKGGGPDSLGRVRSLDLEHMQSPQPPPQRRRASTHALIEGLPVQPPLHSVPFPSVSVRSLSPGPEDVLRSGSRASRLDMHSGHARARSSASLGSTPLLKDATNGENTDPASMRSASPDRVSRLDNTANHGRTASNASMGTLASRNALADDNPFAVRPPSPSRSSRFDPKVRTRTMSTNSMGPRVLFDEVESESRRDRPTSTVELLRPKVLVMPSPLQSAAPPQQSQPTIRPRDGFVTSSDGPPLPPGARSVRPSSQFDLPSPPIASNSFTPNPRANLSLSQLAFRNTLVAGGQRDISYSDIDGRLPRAKHEGEKVAFEAEEESEESPVLPSVPLPPAPPPTENEFNRPAGKLYGRSLIDNLEHRKAEMKDKARVFRGDDRPSMMIRGQIRRSSTYIDPQMLGRPPSQNLDTAMQAMAKHASGGPLVNLNGEKPPALGASASEGNLPQVRSVFGVDTLWDREMAKLKEMEARERTEAEEQTQQVGVGHHNKQKKRGKSKAKSNAPPSIRIGSSPGISESHTAPAVVTVLRMPILTQPPVVNNYDSDTESNDDNIPLGRIRRATEKAAHDWVAEFSEDEDTGPKRTTGVGPRYPVKSKVSASRAARAHGSGEDSEEDLPLAATVQRATQRATRILAPVLDDDDDDDRPLAAAAQRAAKRATQLSVPRLDDDDDDEDKPLGAVLAEGKLPLPYFGFDNLHTGPQLAKDGNDVDDDDDDDEEPLGLRASRIPMASQVSFGLIGGDEDDDKPLALHPEQQRKTQYEMFARMQQQQQHQQMMMQAQIHQSMYFGAPPMITSGFFAPPIVPPMMGMPISVQMPPSPPPLHDPAKFGRVDRWRHDVAVEGSD